MGSPLEKPQRDFLNDLIPAQGSIVPALVHKYVCIQVHTQTRVHRHRRIVCVRTHVCVHKYTHRTAYNSFIYIIGEVSTPSHRCNAYLQFYTQTYPVLQKPTCVQTHSFTCAPLHTHTNMRNYNFMVMEGPVFSCTHGSPRVCISPRGAHTMLPISRTHSC